MATNAKKPTAAAKVEPGSVDELTRVVALALKYQGIPQGVLVHDMTNAGIPVGRVASLLLTTPNTVSQQKADPRPKWPPALTRKGA